MKVFVQRRHALWPDTPMIPGASAPIHPSASSASIPSLSQRTKAIPGPTHGLDRPAQRREQEIAASLHPRHGVLADVEFAGHADLGEVAGLAQLALCHLLGDELRGQLLDLAALGGIEPGYLRRLLAGHGRVPSSSASKGSLSSSSSQRSRIGVRLSSNQMSERH